MIHMRHLVVLWSVVDIHIDYVCVFVLAEVARSNRGVDTSLWICLASILLREQLW